MFSRNIQIIRLISHQIRYRSFSITNIYFNIKSTDNQILNKTIQKDILPIDNQLPTIPPQLPNFLPEPTGVKSKLFDDFYLIYRFGFYRQLRYVQVVKLAQTLATFLITPYKFYTYNEGLIPLSELQLSIFFLSLATCSLLFFGWAATRTVCYLYTTRECERVIIAHIDFWGRRRNIHLDTRDIVPINDIETPNKTILPFKRYSTDHTMYYSLQIGQMLDRPRFNRIFAGIITQDKKTWW